MLTVVQIAACAVVQIAVCATAPVSYLSLPTSLAGGLNREQLPCKWQHSTAVHRAKSVLAVQLGHGSRPQSPCLLCCQYSLTVTLGSKRSGAATFPFASSCAHVALQAPTWLA
jgi:hypothetical protein